MKPSLHSHCDPQQHTSLHLISAHSYLEGCVFNFFISVCILFTIFYFYLQYLVFLKTEEKFGKIKQLLSLGQGVVLLVPATFPNAFLFLR